MSFNALIVEKDEAGATSASVQTITEDRLPTATSRWRSSIRR